jgi:ribulose-bisphosphate carboxylase large chain
MPLVSADNRLRVHYRIRFSEGEPAEERARDVAYEQTVELPAACVNRELTDHFVGRVESVERGSLDRAQVTISYAPERLIDDAAQLLNLLFGNISLKRGIQIRSIEWPTSLLQRFGGPRYGADGLQTLAGNDSSKPLLCAALKPVGLSAEQLGKLCYQFAAGGANLIKDDHGITNQPSAPYRERVRTCQAAVERAQQERGRPCLYFPNVSGPSATLHERLELARDAGCKGVMISPMLTGIDSMQQIRTFDGLALLAHPALSGMMFGDDHGLLPELVLGDLFRILGADGVIYPNVGGRFPFDARQCARINDHLRQPFDDLLASAPAPGGGIDVKLIAHWVAQYGAQTILLVGGSLYAQANLSQATAELMRAIEKASN